MIPSSVVKLLTDRVFWGLAKVRHRRRALHPDGVVLQVTLQRLGVKGCGVPWLDGDGIDAGVARWSKGVGLIYPLPDALGIAMKFTDGDTPIDLLMTTTGSSAWGRHVIHLHKDVAARYSTVIPFHGPSGSVMVSMVPAEPTLHVPAHARALKHAVEQGPLTFTLEVASKDKPWQAVAVLTFRQADAAIVDAPIAFDPVCNALPQTQMPQPFALLRQASYAGSRKARNSALN